MRTLVQSLQDRDRGHLRIVAELWGFDPPSGSGSAAARPLAEAMLAHASEMAAALPSDAAQALEQISRLGGRLPWEELVLRFGPLREMGAGRRDREKPYASPISPLEVLWYRGLLARAFADSPAGPLEYGFIPADLASRMPKPPPRAQTALGKPASRPLHFTPADTFAVDDATTILAAFRREGWGVPGPAPEQREWLIKFLLQPAALDLLLVLLTEGGLLARTPQPDRIREFVEDSREAGLATLQRLYLRTTSWNDLAQLGSLRAPGPQWPNDPVLGRQSALDLLTSVPVGQWWSTADLLAAARDFSPFFLRPPGGFEAWYLQRASDGAFLQGLDTWVSVEGELLRYLISGPLHWLGAVDLASDGMAFRWNPLGIGLRDPQAQPPRSAAGGRSSVRPDGLIQLARTSDRGLRYQIARFCQWESARRGNYTYRISGGGLARALAEGLSATQALRVLSEAAGGKLPLGVERALERWATKGLEAELRPRVVLEVQDPTVLDRLIAQASTGRYLKERFGPTRASVDRADWEPLSRAALRLGLLIGEPEDGPPV